MNAIEVLALVVFTASIVIFRLMYGRLNSNFFFYLLAAVVSLACSGSVSCLGAYLPAKAVADVAMAMSGGFFIAASIGLKNSFRKAGEHDD
jgi:multisubunit Na+/H+ antiporter MnhB subunit